MIKYQSLRERGFTIVELLIVIVVIGILAALVLNSFSGVQAKARDTERQTDVKSIATQAEAWYNQAGQGAYPATADLTSDAWITTNLKGADLNAFRAPGVATNSVVAATNIVETAAGVLPQPSKNQYVYQPLTACTTTGSACVRFNLYYLTESDNVVQMKQSLNR
jgi:prepilin-type N-terminal cleavage/methylation domain-containing protein